MAFYTLPSLAEVSNATRLISEVVEKTPVISLFPPHGTTCSARNIDLHLKCENFQKTGSFKFRGAYHFLVKLDDLDLRKGVVAYSTGNHAQAVAHAAQLISQQRNIRIPSTVVVPSECPPKKILAAQRYGANVILAGTEPDDRVRLATKLQRTTGAVLVPPADHRDIILGQATAVQELLDDVAFKGLGLDAVIVPSGGGGLLCGAVAACKPRGVAVFGAEPESGGPGLTTALRKDERATKIYGPSSIADGLRSLTGEANWEHIRRPENVNQVFTATEAQIKEAMKLVLQDLGFVVEPSAAVPLAVALFNPQFQERIGDSARRPRVGVVLTGGNISVKDVISILPDMRSVFGEQPPM